MFIVLLVLVSPASGLMLEPDVYETALTTPQKLTKLYTQYVTKFKPNFGDHDHKLRIKLFRDAIKKVKEGNKIHGDSWMSGINLFSAMTPPEKRRYLGLNMTNAWLNPVEEEEVEDREGRLSPRSVKSVDWRKQGKVTGVKNQNSCGACWAFAAVAVLETTYAIQTSRRKQFSEQELVDCAYDGRESNTCKEGGFFTNGWFYAKQKGRLATLATVPYRAKDGVCAHMAYSTKPNGLMAAKLKNYGVKLKNERYVLRALNSRPVAVAYEVTDDFNSYDSGIIADETCKGSINHAVTAVGYTQNALIIKNSWGVSWGEKGYFRTARYHHGCQIYNHGYYLDLAYTGKPDTDPEYEPKDDASCKGTNADGCACGTVRCGDGVCRHIHMC